MRPEVWQASASAVGVAGIAGLFLPSVDQAWDSHPTDDFFALKLDHGTMIYIVVVTISAGLQSLAVKSAVPLAFAWLVAGIVVWNYQQAFETEHPKPEGKRRG